MSKPILELCAANQESVLVAHQLKIPRIELCSALELGGLTPSYALIEHACSLKSLNVQVLLRPRPGDFIYTKEEIEILKKDVENCKQLGVDGIVIGFQNKDGNLDVDLMNQFVEIAKPMELCCHRVFDRIENQFAAMDELIQCGVKRILTSGGKPTAEEGKKQLKELVEYADNRIQILAASGINSSNAKEIIDYAKLSQIHFSASVAVYHPLKMGAVDFNNKRRAGEADISYYKSDIETIKKIQQILIQ
jgi:copper homeostasis protein